jgi:type I restriction enzyme S subunit
VSTGWPLVQLRRITRFAYGDSLPEENRDASMIPVFGSNGQVGRHSRANTLGPVIVIGRKGSFGKINYSDQPVFAIDTTYFIDKTQSSSNLRWLYYSLQTLGLDQLTGDVGVPGLNREKAYEQRVPLPPPIIRTAIANYLDSETGRIDVLVAKKQHMIEILQARVNAIVEDATRSLQREWNEVPLKYLVREIDQRLGEHTPPEMLSVSIHYGVVPRSQVTDKLPRAEELSAYKMCDADDIVLNRMRAFQGGVGKSPQAGIVSPDYTVLRPCELVLPQYLHYILRSPWLVGEMTARLRGIGDSELGNVRTPRINFAELGLIRVPLPPIETQVNIVAKIDSKITQTTTLAKKMISQMDLLLEHRYALIKAVVTGQLQVPGVAI